MTPDLFGPEGDCTPDEAAAAVKAVREPADLIAVMRAHMADHPDGVRGDCCSNVALDFALRALDRDEARRSLPVAALAPWRET